MILRRVILIILLFLMGVQGAYAVNDQFEISQLVIGTDNSPPTVPQNVSATAVASDQIDITWDASTDDVGVTGYQVFRDGLQIATSAVTSYSDIGLVDDTSYDYNITAFDAVLNISTSSATSTATTLSIPSGDGSQGGNSVTPRLRDLEVSPEEYAATLSWFTSPRTKTTLKWGISTEYKLGALQERSFSNQHETRITGLDVGTEYFFIITGVDDFNQETELYRGSFTTLSLPDTEAPPNVSGLRAEIQREDVVLTWKNPTISDFDRVRIVRKSSGYPIDPNDGQLVYEGNRETVVDEDAVLADPIQFYAVFAIDETGNTSSGAVVLVRKIILTEDGGIKEIIPPQTDGGDSQVEDTIKLTFGDLIFRQDKKDISFIGSEVFADGEKSLEILIPYERLPEHLKTIVATFENEDGETFSFLLRVNEDKTFYRAVVGAFNEETSFPLSVTVFDFKSRIVSNAEGFVTTTFSEDETRRDETKTFIGFTVDFLRSLGIWVWILLTILLIVLFIYYREREDEEKDLHNAST